MISWTRWTRSPATRTRVGAALGSRTLHSRELYRGLVRFCVEDVRLPNGREVTREVVRHPGAAAIVPVLPDGRLVLIKQFRHATGGDLWEIPAGTLEPPEPPLECARRELVEETGYAAGSLTALGRFWCAPGFCTELMHLYLAEDLRPAEQALETDEQIAVHEFRVEEVEAMVADGRIADAKTLIGWYRYAALLGRPGGRYNGSTTHG